jgi:hypothetical protein
VKRVAVIAHTGDTLFRRFVCSNTAVLSLNEFPMASLPLVSRNAVAFGAFPAF